MAQKVRNSAQPVPVQSAPAVRLYKVKHDSCPVMLVEAYSSEEAAGIYRDEYKLFWTRDLWTEVVEHGGN